MSYLTHTRVVSTGINAFDAGISDLATISISGQSYLYSVTMGTSYAMASYTLDANDTPTAGARTVVNSQGLAGAGPYFLPVDVSGTPYLWVSGVGEGITWTYQIRPDGSFIGKGALSGIDAGSSNQPLIAQLGDTVAFASPRDDSVSFYDISGNSVSNGRTISDGATTNLNTPYAMASASVGGNNFVIVGSWSERGISVIADEATGPRVTASFNTLDEIALMQPTVIETVEVTGKTFVLVGSAPENGASGALTVFELTKEGFLYVTDHLLDTLNTRFGRITALDAIEVNNRTYVAAAGGDDGLTLFGLGPSGQLHHLESIEDTTDINLAGANALEFLVTDSALNLFTAAEADLGISQFTIEGALQHATNYGTAAADALVGASIAAWIYGGSGDDLITGGEANDTIFDGFGSDILSGGGGADMFHLTYDGVADEITDFDPSVDRIDLSDWRYANDPAELLITASEAALILTYRDETVMVSPADGVTLEIEALRDAILFEGARLWKPMPSQCIWQQVDDTEVTFTALSSNLIFDEPTPSSPDQTPIELIDAELKSDVFEFLPIPVDPEPDPLFGFRDNDTPSEPEFAITQSWQSAESASPMDVFEFFSAGPRDGGGDGPPS